MEKKPTTNRIFKNNTNSIGTIRNILASKSRSELENDLKKGSQKLTSDQRSKAYEKEVFEIAQEKDECDLFGINYTKVLDQESTDHLKLKVAALYRLNIL